MSPADAAKLLDLPADATPEQLEARFNELRQKLEDKIAKAPTPGLKAKYRESLDEITLAFETLTLAADSSSLPVASKLSLGGGVSSPRAGSDSGPSQARPQGTALHSKPKSGGKEFALVAIIALAVLAAGGWFVMNTRAENAEKARVAAELAQKAAAEKAEQERLALEKKQAEEAQVLRREKLFAQLRGELAEAKVAWEAIEREERTMDRKLGELKSDLRSLRDVPAGRMAEARATVAVHQRYFDWLSDTLARHPAKVARGKAEELLSARQVDDAAAAMQDLKSALATLEREVSTQRTQMLDLDGVLELNTDANVAWSVEDAFGQVRSGTGSAQLDGIAVGPARLQLRKPAWPERTLTVTISAERPAKPDTTYASHLLELISNPEGAEVMGANGTKLGMTPFKLAELPPGKMKFTLRKAGYYPETIEVTLPAPGSTHPVELRVKPKGLERPPRWNGPAKVRADIQIDTQMTGAMAGKTVIHLVEEWDFSDPDSRSGWQQVIRRFASLSGTNREYMPLDGSALRLRRQPDASWTGEFIQGGLKNPAHNAIWASAPTSFWLVTADLLELFPDAVVEIGGTWPVKSETFFRTIGLKNATGQVQGRLVNLNRDASGEWADIEYSYSYTLASLNGQALMKLRVNLSEGYVVRLEGQDSVSGANGVRATYSTSVTKR